jgi:DNA-binding winged helix-turn-helix (wHTH) protein/TolB-like protein
MRLTFDEYILDVARRELWRGSEPVVVEPQVFDLLVHLVQHPERVVTKDELLQAVWDGRIVSESAITNRINAARRAIGDSGKAQRLIRTVPRKGFRFIGAIEKETVESTKEAVPQGSRRRQGIALAVTAAVSGLLGAAIAASLLWPRAGHPWILAVGMHPAPKPTTVSAGDLRSTIAVLPLTALGDSTDQPELAVGLTEDLTTELSRGGLLVASRETPSAYLAGAIDAVSAGDLLPLIAVLPLTALGNSTDQPDLAASLTQDLTTELSQGGWLVTSRVTTSAYLVGAIDAAQIGRELSVRGRNRARVGGSVAIVDHSGARRDVGSVQEGSERFYRQASASVAYAQDANLSAPNVTVTAPAAPVEPPYMRDPWKAYGRNPYFGRYRVEEAKFSEVPCTQTRIAFGPSGKCLQGYRLAPCDMALDVVMNRTAKLLIEADILAFDPYKVTAKGSPPRWCYVHGYMGYDQEDFQDMNLVTRRGTNWRNLQANGQERSIQFADGPHNCIAVLKPGPVWRGGYIYMMHASICRTDTAAVQAEDIAYVLGSLQARIYDPVGNLRKADDRTTYGPAATLP